MIEMIVCFVSAAFDNDDDNDDDGNDGGNLPSCWIEDLKSPRDP